MFQAEKQEKYQKFREQKAGKMWIIEPFGGIFGGSSSRINFSSNQPFIAYGGVGEIVSIQPYEDLRNGAGYHVCAYCRTVRPRRKEECSSCGAREVLARD